MLVRCAPAETPVQGLMQTNPGAWSGDVHWDKEEKRAAELGRGCLTMSTVPHHAALKSDSSSG